MISVIINTKDRLDSLLECVRSILKQTYFINELIVVDASENSNKIKNELQILLRKSDVEFKFFTTKAGNSFQRNVGIDHLNRNSKYVCFFDDDVVLFEDVIQNYMEKFQKYSDVAAIQGIESNRKPQHFLGKMVRKMFLIGYEEKEWKLLPSGEHTMVIDPINDKYVGSFMTGFTCVRRSILDEYRFDEWFQKYAFLEDFDFSYRIAQNYKILISPDLKLIHNRSIVSRLNAFEMTRMFMINKSYFFFKNIDKKVYLYLAFYWSLIGHLVLNIGKSFYKKDAGYFLGSLSGIFGVIRGEAS